MGRTKSIPDRSSPIVWLVAVVVPVFVIVLLFAAAFGLACFAKGLQ